MKRTIISSTVILFLFIACSKDSVPSATDCTTAKSFATDVSPIIQSNCALSSGCHANGSSNGPGPLTNYSQVFNSRTAIKTAVANGSMPQNGSLTTAQKNAIICWIDSGAANN
jgi:hypothetical protein